MTHLMLTMLTILTTHSYDTLDYQNDYREALNIKPIERYRAPGIRARAEYVYNNKPIPEDHGDWTSFIDTEYRVAGENICDKGYWEEKDFHIESDFHCIDAFKASPTHKQVMLMDWDSVSVYKYNDILIYWYIKN